MKTIGITQLFNHAGGALKQSALALAVAAGLAAGSVQAATLTWGVAGDGAWDTSTPNWTGDATTFVSDGTQDVIFDKIEGGTITIASGMSPLSTTVSAASGTYIFSGGPIATGSLTKDGDGTLTLASANTYIGTTTVNAGTLTANGNTAIGGSTSYAVAGGANLLLSGTNVANYKWPAAPATLTGAGTVSIPLGGKANIGLRFDMSAYTGNLSVSGGMMAVNPFYSPGFVSPASGTIEIQNNTTLYLGWQGTTFTTTVKLSGGTDNGEGYGVLRGDTATLNGAVVLGTNSTIGCAGGTFTINAVISDGENGFGFTKVQSGTVVLTAANTYQGPTVVNSGILKCDAPDALGSGALTIKAGGPKVNLNYSGTKTVASLTLGVVPQLVAGTYGSTSSTADFKSDYFVGSGMVELIASTSQAYMLSFGTNVVGSTAAIGTPVGGAAAIAWTVPFGTDPALLAPSYTLSVDATCPQPNPGVPTPTDFGDGPVEYVVTSAGAIPVVNVYTVTVTVLPDESTLIWNSGGGSWNFTSPNWKGVIGGLPTPFFNGVNAVFENTAGGMIDIVAGVMPLSTTVSAGNYTFSGQPIGSGVLTKSGGGTLQLNVTPANFGSIAVNGGTLYLYAAETGFAPNAAPFTIPNVTVESGATLEGYRAHATGGTLTLNGGRYWEWNGWNDGGWWGPIVLAANSYFGRTEFWCYAQTLGGEISGPGGFTYDSYNNQQSTPLTLAVANSYEGPTVVNSGRVVCQNSASLGSGGALSIAAIAKVDLNYAGNHVVASLTIAGAVKLPGVYGSSSSPAPLANQDDVHFSGTGTVTVAGGYSDWALANAPGQTPGQDYDNDGVENGLEYFMGQTGSSFTAMPGLDATNTVTWTKDSAYSGTWQVQTSPDLDAWTNVAGTDNGTSVSYTLPTGLGTAFVRLLVTPTP